ncbi:endo-beta-N-acetylglucosaminidase D [Anaerobacterium chartisolvens]|uniref:Endo-beta-N-acetylglucosaminidase D n=1 Tax=Anaerobacterium chartisolvens TaxID=1297424 RepID=A0A369B941_9FIRM|nr:Ig-like domain-containing protein [Anaerobacterium chartisolvens]RCX17845.1 endo-beta-N-acetylglucosaminidase D [Anaerobacterium chartisolvens]
MSGKLIKRGSFKKALAFVLTVALVSQSLVMLVVAGDTWPFKGESAHGVNQPSVHGYTSGQILDWSPETDPGAEMLRSFIPLQQRINAFAQTQANPNLDPKVKMFNLAGDYGNAFIENAAYTNKFAQYHFNFWQYVDYYSYWHGTATAYTPPQYYDDLAQSNWQQKWFEFGCLNIPNPTYTDAAHKNGVLSLACVFFSNNDRGQQTYKQMIVKDENGKFPVAEKMVEMAHYFGYDGYFFNQEEVGPNIQTQDIPDYIAFLKVFQKEGLYVQWYDSVNTGTGSNSFARTFADSNISWLYDRAANEPVTNSFFFDYGVGSALINSSNSYLNALNSNYGTNYNIFDVGFAGLEGGRDRFKSVQGSALNSKLNGSGLPDTSIAVLGTDFVHAGLDEDMGLSWPVSHRSENDYQWMTTVRDRLWWSGPNQDPKNTAKAATNGFGDVYADNRYWPGIASVISERSVIEGTNFFTNFNTGHGLSYYVNGSVSNNDEWSNMSLQDIPVTWQWWQETTGNKLEADFDYGEKYSMTGNTNNRFAYQKIGGYNGGSSLVVNGNLNAEDFLRLYKTEISINANSKLSITYNKPSDGDASTMSVGLIFKDAPDTVVKVPVADSGNKTAGWISKQLDLSAYAGRTAAVMGLVFDNGGAAIDGYQMNIGQIRVYDGSAAEPSAPSGLEITDIFVNTGEMNIKWDMDTDYSKVKQYNVYVNDIYVGGKYDGVLYIKKLPAASGTVKVVPVGADGVEGEAASVPFDLGKAGSNINVESKEDGNFNVSWTNPVNASGDITVKVRSLNLKPEAVISKETTVPSGSVSAAFTDMPVNGDDYIVQIAVGSNPPVSVSGNFIDKVCEPYAEEWSWNGNTLNLPMPNTRDWRYMYVYEDGNPKQFATTYSVGNKPMIIRGRSTKSCLKFTSSAETMYVVMEDYEGNKSERIYLRQVQITLPDVTTGEASDITAEGAVIHGNITSDGNDTISERGFVYSQNNDPTEANGTVIKSAGVQDSFSASITGLEMGTAYYYRAYAVNSEGIAYGEVKSFNTLTGEETIPQVATGGAENITYDSAALSAEVTSDGGSMVTERGFIYSQNASPSEENGTLVKEGSGSGSYKANITGLSSQTKYYYRAYAANSEGTAYGEIKNFITRTESVKEVMKVDLESYFNRDGFSYDSNREDGNFDGGNYPWYFCYSADLVEESGITSYNGIDFQWGSFTDGDNNVIDCTGQDIDFDEGSYASIMLLGSTTDGNKTGTFTINYSESDGSEVSVAMNDWCTSGQDTVLAMTHRHRCTNEDDNTPCGIFAYYLTPERGTTVTGLTLPDNTNIKIMSISLMREINTPTVITGSASEITQNSAEISGQVESDGGSTVTQRGFVYSTDNDPTEEDSKIAVEGGDDSFSTSIEGLESGTTYYYRAYATNSVGTFYGDIKDFTTLAGTVAVESVSLEHNTLTLEPGQAGQLTAEVLPEDASNKNVVWQVVNESAAGVVTVSGGLVTAVKEGTATVRASSAEDASKYAECAVTVNAGADPVIPVEQVSLNKTTVSLQTGASEQLTAAVLPEDASNKNVVWQVLNESTAGVVTVSGGLVTAAKAGTATVRASSAEDASKYAECSVTVTEPSYTPPSNPHSSSSESTPLPKPQVQANQDGTATIVIAPVLDGNKNAKASIGADVIKKAVEMAKEDSGNKKTVMVSLPEVKNARQYSVELPVSVLSSAVNDKAIIIDTASGSVALPGNMLYSSKEIKDRITVSIGKADKEGFGEGVKHLVGDRPSVEVKLQAGAKEVQWNGGSVTMSLAYRPSDKELSSQENIVVLRIDQNGSSVPVPSSRFNPVTGKVVFTTDTPGKYAVAYVSKTFDDAGQFKWAQKQIEVLASKGVIDTDRTEYEPAEDMTRGEFIGMLVRALGLYAKADQNFNDVGEDYKYSREIATAKALGIATGGGTDKFSPDKEISRQDIMVLADRALQISGRSYDTAETDELQKFNDEKEIASYARQSIANLVKAGIVKGGGKGISPKGNITRASAAVMIYNLISK